LADGTDGRVVSTSLCLLSVVCLFVICRACIVAKRYVLPENSEQLNRVARRVPCGTKSHIPTTLISSNGL